LKSIEVFEEHKFRFICPNCSHKNSPSIHENDGQVKKELTCWACGLEIVFVEKEKVWKRRNIE